MKLLPHRDEVRHNGNGGLAAEDSNEVYESRECGGVCTVLKGPCFKRLQNNTCHQSNVCTPETDREKELYCFKGLSGPQRIAMRAQPAAHRDRRDSKPPGTWQSGME